MQVREWLFLAAMSLVSPSVLADESPFQRSTWEGLSEFVDLARSELGSARLILNERIAYDELKPEDAVLLIHPEGTLDSENLARFMRDGGRVLLFDDYGDGDELLGYFGIQRVPLPDHPADQLRHNPALPLAQPSSMHVVTENVQKVALNHASGVHHSGLSPLLHVQNGGGGPDVQVALAGAVERGRLLVVGDSSFIINDMLRYRGNRAFARGCVKYAVDDDTWGPRRGRLFVTYGPLVQRGSYRTATPWLDEVRHAMVQSLSDAKKHGLSDTMAYILSVITSASIVAWLTFRVARRYRPRTPSYARPIPLEDQGGVAGRAALASESRTLALLDVKAAVHESLLAALPLEEQVDDASLATRAVRAGILPAEMVPRLEHLLRQLATTEVASPDVPLKATFRSPDVVQLAKEADSILTACSWPGRPAR